MNEVSCRAIRMLFDALEAVGLPTAGLAEGTPHSLEHLRDVRQWVDWDSFARVTRNAIAASEGKLTRQELGRGVGRSPAHSFLRAMTGFLFRPRTLMELGSRWVGPTIIPMLTVAITAEEEGFLEVAASVPSHLAPCPEFFEISAGILEEFHLLLGVTAPRVLLRELTGHRAVYRIEAPARLPLRAALRRKLGAVLQLGRSLELVWQQREQLEAAQASAGRARQELQALLTVLPAAVAIHRRGVVLWVNAAFARAAGLAPLELAGRPLLDCVHPADRADFSHHLRGARGFEFRAWQPEGGALASGARPWLALEATATLDYEGAPAELLTATDITERRRLEAKLQLSERLATLGTLSAGLAHELNNPLAFVDARLALASRALQAGDAAATGEALGVAQEGMARLQGIVRDLRTFSKAHAQELGVVEVHEVLRATLKLAGPTLGERAHVREALAPVPGVRANPGRLAQVALNLVMNAVEAQRAEGERHSVEVSTALGADGCVVLRVSDDGAGLSASARERLFEPFFSTKAQGQGTGLGLSLCKHLVAEMGGTLEVLGGEAAAPWQTVAEVRLPAAQPELASAPAARERGARRRVLVIDDEPNLLKSMELLLTDAHDVVGAASGEAALRLLARDSAFDAVVCDLMLGEVDGVQVYEAARALEPGLEQRFVFMTGGAFAPRARSFLTQVKNPTLDKPFAVERLLAAIEEAVARA